MLLPLLLAGCGDCDGPYARCEGNVAANCGYRWVNEVWGRWERFAEACGDGHCQVPADERGAAFCALDAEPDPRTPEDLRDAWPAAGCVDGEVVTWRYGYRVAVEACGARVCVDRQTPGFGVDDPAGCAGTAFCSAADQPDPVCVPGVFTTCEADHIVYCACGFRSEAHACANPGPTCRLEPFDGLEPQGVCR